MHVIEAEVMGMCFGVRDALRRLEGIDRPEEATIHGELVHNDQVLYRLEDRGFRMRAEADRDALPEESVVVVTAHGISHKERARLTAAGKRLVDTTCPLVTRVHRAAETLRDAGYFLIVIGRRGHVEVQGIVEDQDQGAVVESPEQVETYDAPRIGVICQTTTTTRMAEDITEAIRERNPSAEVRFVDTVCQPTKEHQRALEELIERVPAVVVVGGRNSNNTKALVARCRAEGRAAWHVESAAELDPRWFEGIDRVGLTAGTSTLDETIDEVRQVLRAINASVLVGGPAS